jgi:poly-gamma-glutamate system protein
VVDEATRAELSATDPLRTGLVGVEWSGLTTTPGALAAKRTTTHPLWVAVFRAWFSELKMQPGEAVAIGSSGSFPATLLAARIAAESQQLSTIVIGSLTSSNYGANIPGMDLAEMDRVLRAAGILSQAPVAFSPGGQDDAARDLEPADRQALYTRLSELGPLAHIPDSLEASIDWREELFLGAAAAGTGAPGRARLFINIGGHSANYGVGVAPLALPAGLISGAEGRALLGSGLGAPGDSVALRAARSGVPVINILNIRALAVDNGIPFDPPRAVAPAMVHLPGRLGIGHRLAAGALSLALLIWLAAWRVPRPGPRLWFELGRRALDDRREPDPGQAEVSQ